MKIVQNQRQTPWGTLGPRHVLILFLIGAALIYGGLAAWRDGQYLSQGEILTRALVQARSLRDQVERNIQAMPPVDPCRGLAQVYEVQGGAKIVCRDGYIRIDTAAGISGVPPVSIELRFVADQNGHPGWRCINLTGRVSPALPHVCMP